MLVKGAPGGIVWWQCRYSQWKMQTAWKADVSTLIWRGVKLWSVARNCGAIQLLTLVKSYVASQIYDVWAKARSSYHIMSLGLVQLTHWPLGMCFYRVVAWALNMRLKMQAPTIFKLHIFNNDEFVKLLCCNYHTKKLLFDTSHIN